MQKIAGSNYTVLVLLAVVVFGLYGHNLNGFWRGDDTAILLHGLRHSILDIFLEPAAWQELSASNLTPLLSFSFYVDYWIAGLNPRMFYAHQLIVICLIGFMAYLLLSKLINKWLALGGALLVLLGTPMVVVSSQLMTRHYVEGLLLSLLCLYFFLLFQAQEKQRFFWLALLCYIIAMTAKEVYVPLGILLVALVIQRGEAVVERALPIVLIMGGYVLWRSYMLPGVVGGYTDQTEIMSVGYVMRALEVFANIPSIVLGGYSTVLMILFIAVIGWLLWTSQGLGLLVLLTAGLIMGPLLPLVVVPGIVDPDRYLLLPWFAFGFVLVFAIGKMVAHYHTIVEQRSLLPVAGGVIACVIAVLFIHQRVYSKNVEAFIAKVELQIRFFWEHDQSVALIPDSNILNNFWLIETSREVKELVHGATSPTAVVDEIFLDEKLPLFEYSADCSCMSDISDTVPARLVALNASNRKTAPLNLQMTNTDGLISWQFGPYTDGAYHVVSEELGNLALPAVQNNLRTNYRHEITLYLKYIAPEGWVSYSPRMQLRADGMPMIWARE